MASTLFGGALGSRIIIYNSIGIGNSLIINKKGFVCVGRESK